MFHTCHERRYYQVKDGNCLEAYELAHLPKGTGKFDIPYHTYRLFEILIDEYASLWRNKTSK